MWEEYWLGPNGASYNGMLSYMEYRASKRKLYLFACACCRRVFRFLTRAEQDIVRSVEEYADCGRNELLASIVNVTLANFRQVLKEIQEHVPDHRQLLGSPSFDLMYPTLARRFRAAGVTSHFAMNYTGDRASLTAMDCSLLLGREAMPKEDLKNQSLARHILEIRFAPIPLLLNGRGPLFNWRTQYISAKPALILCTTLFWKPVILTWPLILAKPNIRRVAGLWMRSFVRSEVDA